jgi:hypothetical protein
MSGETSENGPDNGISVDLVVSSCLSGNFQKGRRAPVTAQCSNTGPGRVHGVNVHARRVEFCLHIRCPSGLTPDSRLWESGLLDSVGLLECVVHLEGLVGRELAVGPGFLESFETVQSVYATHIAS